MTHTVSGSLHQSARPEADRGPVDPSMRLDHVILSFRPSAVQQAELDQLLADQQNPGSPRFHKWLSPEEYAARFGLSAADESKVGAWLESQGLEVKQQARGRNWVAFSGTARNIGRALRTEIRKFAADGVEHFANATEASVPAALADIVGGFIGLDDFIPESRAHRVPLPEFNAGSSHYLVPGDIATIYNVAPLYESGLDGAGQSIVVVGQSAVDPNDLQLFKARHNLPANDPEFILYGGADPGFTGAETEGLLDLEWAGAMAPKATLYYVYGTSAFSAMIYAINLNIAPIISVSYGTCEYNASPTSYRAIAQQANAQGITILVASGDSGAAACDPQGVSPLANRGMVVDFPSILPEVTAVGGTQFVEGTGTYWAGTNSGDRSSALSYIPEAAWNESGMIGLLSTGGGISQIYPKPAWQNVPGITGANFRHSPDVSLSAGLHDAYIITYQGGLAAVGGTSASAPALAGILTLLNQYQVLNGIQAEAGLGNVNPQLYRLSQSAPGAFHDIVAGDNVVPCSLGSPDCLTGKFGYAAATGYDLATGLGSIDAANLFANWNSKTNSVSVSLVLSTASLSLNDSLNVTALVTAATDGTPTGTVTFSANNTPLGSAALAPRGSAQAADLTVPAYLLGSGTSTIVASYAGDAAFSGGGAAKSVRVTIPTNAAGILIDAPSAVWPQPVPDALGLSWQTSLTVREIAGVPCRLTSFSIDGMRQPLAQYFSSTTIPASGSIAADVLFRDISAPTTRVFGFSGIDAAGNVWSRSATVRYMPLPATANFVASATPLVVAGNAGDPACPWPVQVNVEDWGGSRGLIEGLWVGGISYATQIVPIFGTGRLEAWGSLQGTICVSGMKPPASAQVEVDLSTGQYAQVLVSFAAPPAGPATLSASPQAVTLQVPDTLHPAQATLAVGVTSVDAEWSVTVLPGNRTTKWLTVSSLSGKGPGRLTLAANGAGFAPGAYRALLVIQSASATPQTVTVPVMLVLGPRSSGIAIDAVVNAATFTGTAAPGSLISVFGSHLARTTGPATGNPIDFVHSEVTASVNGVPAPVLYASPTQLNVQVPYEAGAGPAVLSINNKGQVAGFLFQLAAAAPGIFTDAAGGAVPQSAVKAGTVATVYVTGAGEVTPALDTGYSPTASNRYKAVQPVSVTAGGVPAFVQSAALAINKVGVLQVNFIVPKVAVSGTQPVVVTVGKFSSPPVNLVLQ
jgi:uncharacterized protein (TIGR03437 family)